MRHFLPVLLCACFGTPLPAQVHALSGRGANQAQPLGSFEASRISDSVRAHPTMMGGWGPHLRSLMTAPDGSLWFADDQGGSVLRNDRVRYFQLVEGYWEHIGSNEFYPAFGNIQQNSAHVMRNEFILSYGVDTSNQWLMECYFDTSNPSYKACNTIYVSGAPFILPSNSNYVGAAVSASGTKVVWWIEVRNGAAAPGYWHYLYNFGSGWNGPVSTRMSVAASDYEFLGYVHATFTGANQFSFVAETYNAAGFAAVTGDVSLGSPAQLSVHPGTINGNDIWSDAASGDLHALLYASGENRYLHRPHGGGWSTAQLLPGTWRGRFIHDEVRGKLHLVTGGSNSANAGIEVRSVHESRINGAIDWLGLEARKLHLPYAGLDVPSAIYVPSASHQTQPVDALRFAIVGQAPPATPARDHESWHFEFLPCTR